MAKKLAFDKVLFTTIVLLVALGLVMVYSASAVVGGETHYGLNRVFLKQILAVALGYARQLYDRSVVLSPDQTSAFTNLYTSCIDWKGDTVCAREVLELAPGLDPDDYFDYQYIKRNYAAALNILSSVTDSLRANQWNIDVAAMGRGRMLGWLGRQAEARLAYDTALGIVEAELDKRPDDHRLHGALGLVYACLGRKEEAIREGLRGKELMPRSRDALIATRRMTDLAMIYTMVGEHDLALDEIEELLSIPSWLSVNDLRVYSTWDPLRNNPRFQALLKKGHKVF